MAIKRIRTYPDPILRAKARKVPRINDEIRKLGADMLETLLDAEGVGLAAPQIGVLKRVIALNLPEEDGYWLVNPEILATEGVREVIEGCLSVPGYEGLVTRSVTVKARALDAHGGKWRVTAEELLAQVLEHEIDHLNGIMYMDHLLEHERLRELNPDHDESAPHQHDVEYHVHVDHRDDAAAPAASTSTPELLTARATLSEATSRHDMRDLAYDLRAGTGATAPSTHDSDVPDGNDRATDQLEPTRGRGTTENGDDAS